MNAEFDQIKMDTLHENPTVNFDNWLNNLMFPEV